MWSFCRAAAAADWTVPLEALAFGLFSGGRLDAVSGGTGDHGATQVLKKQIPRFSRDDSRTRMGIRRRRKP